MGDCDPNLRNGLHFLRIRSDSLQSLTHNHCRLLLVEIGAVKNKAQWWIG